MKTKLIILAVLIIVLGGGWYYYKNNPSIPSDWLTYTDVYNGFSFKYPSNLEVRNNTQLACAAHPNEPFYSSTYCNTNVGTGLYSLEGNWVGAIESAVTPYFNPGDVDVSEYILKDKVFEQYYDGTQFNNKIAEQINIAGLPTVHLQQNTRQGGTYDEFFFIDKGRMYQIQLTADDAQLTADSEQWKNLDMTDKSSWQIRLLKSFKFTK